VIEKLIAKQLYLFT